MVGEFPGYVIESPGLKLDVSRGPLLMGVLNVTPDSFSDGGEYLESSAALGRGLAMAAEGADIIDIGAESTRPGSEGVSADDQTHRETWNLLRELVGHPDFLYVADCKLATMDNMRYIDQQGGRFVSVLPATRKEDAEFRRRLLAEPDGSAWKWLHDILDEHEEVEDRVSIWPRETLTADGYRLWWFHSTRKAERDEAARRKKIDRAIGQLDELRCRMN